jgi:flagellar capping protein FliD
MEDLQEENAFIPVMSKKVKELDMKTEGFTKLMESERMKFRELERENEDLTQQLEIYEVRYSGENTLENLKQQIDDVSRELNEKNRILDSIFSLSSEKVELYNDEDSALIQIHEIAKPQTKIRTPHIAIYKKRSKKTK